MDAIKEFASLLAPLLLGVSPFVGLAILQLMRQAKRSEQNDKNQVIDYLRLEGYMVKYCGLPIEVFLADLKEKGVFLSNVPDDSLLTQIIERQVKG